MRILLPLFLLLSAPAMADSRMEAAPLANVQLKDPAQERQAKALMETIRCLVCQGQSIADSDAEMAGDMRSMIRERIEKGEQPEAIRKWLITRYGDWVTYEPPLSSTTLFLWSLPALLLMAGGALALGRIRRKR
ncbi:cytochrome c-type biogenesis protein CcmH [Chakrabartia godavariana]|nr:cytochrome c-type biogenesis protein CcmH [Chakrabartia godavariana]